MAIPKILLLIAIASITLAAPAQTPAAATTPAFDVVSIKPSKPGSVGSDSTFNANTFTARNSTLKSLLEYDAYGIPGPQIIGIPPALTNAAFDIEAKVDPSAIAQMRSLGSENYNLQSQRLVQKLLADRFKLAVHFETRQLPVYALVVAKGGPKLQDAKNPSAGAHRTARTGQLKAEGVTTADLAQSLTRILSTELGRIVIDQTGLTGKYDLTLKWTPDTSPPPMLNGEPDTSAPSIFTAIQEQLGLKLESTKAPASVLVIDHAEMPSLN